MSNYAIKGDLANLIGIREEERQAALYIKFKYPDIFEDIEKAEKVAKMIMKEHDATLENFKLGQMDHQIRKYAEFELMRQNSIKEKKTKTELKTKKKKTQKKLLIGIIVGTVATAGVFYVGHEIKDYFYTGALISDVTYDLGKLSGDDDTLAVDRNTIVKRHTTILGYDKNNDVKVSYEDSGIANEIIDVCEKDPKLLDVTLIDTYLSMVNRTSHMDNIYSWLKAFTSTREEYKEIYEQLKDYDYFLDYLVGKGYIKANEEVKIVIENYKKQGGFYNLSEKEQEILENACKNLEKVHIELAEENKYRIDDLLEKYKNKLGGR